MSCLAAPLSSFGHYSLARLAEQRALPA